MTKRERRKWLQDWKAEVIRTMFLRHYMQGTITLTELNEIFRTVSRELKLPDLKDQEKWNVVEIITPTKDKVSPTHLKTVKNSLYSRLRNFKLRTLLFKPVVIPGPPPGAKVAKPRIRIVRGLKIR